MTDIGKDINDDEIRIISPDDKQRQSGKGAASASDEVDPEYGTDQKRRRYICYGLASSILLVLALVALIMYVQTEDEEAGMDIMLEKPDLPVPEAGPADIPAQPVKGYTVKKDTTVNGIDLSMYIPYNATPTLEVGNQSLEDSTVVLMVQAADVRRDNGEIVCSFVVKGELVSKGEAKAGFCSIINGKISIGVADATPMFEEVLMSDGYFFRQYPLVVAGQVVENKLKGRSIRKALAEMDGNVGVVCSKGELSLHDFSQALVDAGARNAIYIVGGSSAGTYMDEAGEKISFGTTWSNKIANVNYIVWR